MAPRSPRTELTEPLPESDRSGELKHPREQMHLYGHAEAASSLAKAARSGQLHHAWLIAGPKGVGKATLAWRFARALLVHCKAGCPDNLSVDPANVAAHQVMGLTHPDLALLRRPWDTDKKRFKTELVVDEVRKLHGFFSRHASFGGPKIAIVDCMDDMNPQSQNALLKILEEPPKGAILLLIAHAPGRLLPTIRSRCRLLQLRKLSDEDMAAAMTELGAGQQPAERDLVRALAGGAPGFAAFLSASGAAPLYQDLLALLGQLPRLNLSTQIAMAERLARQPIETGTELFTTLMTLLLQRLVRSASGSITALDQERRAFDIMRHALPDADWVDLWSSLRDQFQRADALNLDKKQFVLNAFYSIESAASRRANART